MQQPRQRESLPRLAEALLRQRRNTKLFSIYRRHTYDVSLYMPWLRGKRVCQLPLCASNDRR
jgi:hypothetical protein